MTLSNSGKKSLHPSLVWNKKQQNEKEQAKQKAVKLLKTLGLTALAGLGATGGVLALSKNKNIYKKLNLP